MSPSNARRDVDRLRASELLSDLAAQRDLSTDQSIALEQTSEALDRAEHAEWREGMAFALLQQARRQKPAEAYRTLLEAIQLFRRLEHASGEACSMNNLGMTLQADGQTTLAHHFLTHAHHRIIELDGSVPRDHALVLLNLTIVSFEHSSTETALSVAGESLDFCRRHHFDDLLARGLWITGHLLWRRGLDQTALRYEREALDLLGDGTSWDRAQALAALARTCVSAGLDREAIDAGHRAAELFLQWDAQGDRGVALITTGTALMHLADISGAEKCFSEAVAIGKRTQSPRIHACALRMLGDLGIRSGQAGKGMEYAREALEIAEECRQRVLQGLVCAVLYRGAKHLGDTIGALGYLERALLLAPGFGHIEGSERFNDLPVHAELETLWRRQSAFTMALPS